MIGAGNVAVKYIFLIIFIASVYKWAYTNEKGRLHFPGIRNHQQTLGKAYDMRKENAGFPRIKKNASLFFANMALLAFFTIHVC